MKIIWLADYKQEERPGGAQITNRKMIEHGRSIGLDIKEVTLKMLKKNKIQLRSDYYFYIINNFVLLNREFPSRINRLLEEANYIRYIHDYDWLYPDLKDETITKMFSNAKATVFLSPLHKQIITDSNYEIKKSFIVPSPISSDDFHVKKTGRINKTTIFAGEIASHKGVNHVLNYALMNPDQQIDMYGWIGMDYLVKTLPDNVTIKKKAEHGSMADLFNKYEEFIHLPIWNEPFGRSAAEAYLCGCKMVTNDNVGFMSFDWNYDRKDQVSKKLDEAPQEFWDNILPIIKKPKMDR